MKKKRVKIPDNKGWASFRIRGIKTSLEALEVNEMLSTRVRRKLSAALAEINIAVAILDKEKQNDN